MNIFKIIRLYTSYFVNLKSEIPKMKIDSLPHIYNCKENVSLTKAVDLLREGHVIAVPTDTIYGLACSANCPDAIRKLYSIKGRDSAKPVAICVSSILDVRKWGQASHLSDELLKNLLPGPLTVVLEKTMDLDNPFLNPHTTKIGIRIPNHKFINSMTELFDKPVALTSANFSNEPSSLRIEEFRELYNKLGAVFDGGILSEGLDQNRSGSTVVDLSQAGCYKIIRKGISYEKTVCTLKGFNLIARSE